MLYTNPMKCPNCHSNLETGVYDGIEINHCPSCGGTFFDLNEINRISIETARALAEIKRSDSLSSGEKFCPRDKNSLKVHKDESIPLHVTVLRCPKCAGIFVFADDLLEFKQAQEAKINYFKTWRIPFPAMKTVLIASFFVMISVSVITSAYLLQKPQTTFIQAETICSRLQIIPTDDGFLAFCTSETPLISKAKLYCTDGEREIIINSSPTTTHSLQIDSKCSAVQFIFEEGRSRLETEIMPLVDR